MWNDTQDPLIRQTREESILDATSDEAPPDRELLPLPNSEHRPQSTELSGQPAAEVPTPSSGEPPARLSHQTPVERAFEEASPDFLTELEKLRDPVLAASLADRWAADTRSWSRVQLLAYLDGVLRYPGHQPLVKRLYRAAERRNDMELVGAFLVAFDRLVTHARRPAPSGDIRLSALQNVIPSFRRRKSDDTWHDHRSKVPLPHRGRIFSYRTRYYLRRRAWRAIRRFAHLEPERYPTIAASLLARYTDDDLATGERVLDRWGLLQICYRHHPVLAFGRHTVRLQPGRRLASLTPAPSFLSLWQMPAASDALLRLMVEARSHLVRRWAHQLLLAEHAARLRSVSPLCWLPLLERARPEIADFACEGLKASTTLDKLSVDECLPLLQTRHVGARQFVRQRLIERIDCDELSRADLVTLCTQSHPDLVAAAWSKFLPSTAQAPAAFNRAMAHRLAGVRCHRFAVPIATWALSLITEHRAQVRAIDAESDAALWAYFDHPFVQVRKLACRWWTARKPAEVEPAFWARLCTSHRDDVQHAMVAWLARHTGDSLLGKARPLPPAIVQHAWTLWETILARDDASVRTLELTIDEAAAAVAHTLTDGTAASQSGGDHAPPIERIVHLLARWAGADCEAVAARALAGLAHIAQASETGSQLVNQALPALGRAAS